MDSSTFIKSASPDSDMSQSSGPPPLPPKEDIKAPSPSNQNQLSPNSIRKAPPPRTSSLEPRIKVDEEPNDQQSEASSTAKSWKWFSGGGSKSDATSAGGSELSRHGSLTKKPDKLNQRAHSSSASSAQPQSNGGGNTMIITDAVQEEADLQSSPEPTDSERLSVLNALKKAMSGNHLNGSKEELNTSSLSDQGSSNGEKRDMYTDLKRRITLGRNWKLSQGKQQGHKKTSLSMSFESDSDDSSNSQSQFHSNGPISQTQIPSSTVDASFSMLKERNRAPLANRSISTPPVIETVTPQPVPDTPTQGLPVTAQLTPEKRKKYVEVRKYILNELLTTEKNFVAALEIVLNQFKAPLARAAQGDKDKPHGVSSSTFSVASSSFFGSVNEVSTQLHRTNSVHGSAKTPGMIIPMVDIKIMFAFIDDLWEFSKEFCEELRVVVEQWEKSEAIWESLKDATGTPKLGETPLSIGELFSSHSTHFGIYLKFVDNYSAAKEAIRRSEESSPSYRQFISDCLKSKECQKQGISDFLILPIQRVTRYVLLLQDLKKHTPPDHPDYARILSALDEMRKLANTVNEVKRREEEMTRMFHVVRSVEDCPPTIISAQRRILFEVDAFDMTREYSHLALHPIAISNAGISVVPTMAAAVPGNDGGLASLFRVFIFNDLLLLARPKAKKKRDKSISKYMNTLNLGGGDPKKDKMVLFRLSWLKDVEIIEVGEDSVKSPPNKEKHLVKLVIHNSDAGSAASRRKFWTELANANNKTVSATKKRPSISTTEVLSDGRISPTVSQFSSLLESTRNSPDKKSEVVHGANKSDDAELSLPTVESIERLARERIHAEEGKTNEKDVIDRRASANLEEANLLAGAKHLQRAATIASRSPTPRSTSLVPTNPNIASLLEQMSFDTTSTSQDRGVITTTPSTIPTKPLPNPESLPNASPLDLASSPPISIDSFISNDNTFDTSIAHENSNLSHTLRESPSRSSVDSSNSSKAAVQHAPLTTTALSPPQQPATTITETFILEFPEKKQKHELLIVLERLLKQLRDHGEALP